MGLSKFLWESASRFGPAEKISKELRDSQTTNVGVSFCELEDF